LEILFLLLIFYFLGCIVNGLLLGSHYALGCLLYSKTQAENLSKIGVHLSYIEGIGGNKIPTEVYVYDCALSWMACFINAVTFIGRLGSVFTFIKSSKEIKQINLKIKTVPLPAEHVLYLDYKLKYLTTGNQFKMDEIDQTCFRLKNRGLEFDKSKFMLMVADGDFVKLAA
jgi:hypothetical protein